MKDQPEHITNDLIIAFLNKESDADGSRLVENWIASSDENRKYFEDLKVIWEEAEKLEPVPVEVNVDAAWDKLNTRIEKDEPKVAKLTSAKTTSSLYKTILKIAAVLIPALIVIYFLMNPRHEVKQLVFETSSDTLQKQLPDGSTIKLNTHSKLSYPEEFSGTMREVSLEGEAFFEVSPDKEKPFIVHAAETNIQVLGTSFNIDAYRSNQNIEVLVKTGHVLFYIVDSASHDTSRIELYAGDKGVFEKKTKKLFKEESVSENEIYWITKTLVFSKTDLTDVAERLKNVFGTHIRFNNEDLGKLKLSATFKEQTAASILDVIAETFDLKITKADSVYEIDRKDKP